MAFYDKWFSMLKSPKETFAAETANASIGNGMIQLIIGIICALMLIGLGSLILVGIIASILPIGNALDSLLGAGLGYALAIAGIFFIFYLLLAIVAAVVFSLIHNLVIFLVARLFGGQGSFTEQFYLFSIISAAFNVLIGLVYIPLLILMIVPFIGILGILVFLGISIASLYYQVLAVAQAHKVSTGKALAIILVPVIIIGAFLIVIVMSSVLWYTGVFNPAKFRSGPECGGFGAFTCIDQSVSSSSSVFSLGNAVGRSIEVKSATVSGMYAPSECTIDDRLGAGSRTITATSRIFIECGLSSAPVGSTYDWTISVEYVDSQSGLSKTDYGGFVRGKVAGGANSGVPQSGAVLPIASNPGNYPQSGYQAASQCGGFGSFTCIDQSATAPSSTIVLGNALERNIEIQSASLTGSGAPINCFAQSGPGSASPLVYANGKVYIECGKSTLSSGSPYDWEVSLTYKDVPSGLSHTDSGGFVRGKMG